ncbi:MAG: metal-dependent transcriptional regulator [Candidatus Bipolaricaulota bacterium]|nr:metal-dependent transcriptional regulator [Candidatus Bipolaricaulota bacterium]
MNKAEYTHNRAREEEEDVLRLLIEQTTRLESWEEPQLREALDLSAHDFSVLIAGLEAKEWLRRDGAQLSLTPVGTEVARNLLDRHQTAERFFNEILGEPPAAAHAVAEKLEHVISQQALEELKKSLARARGATPLIDILPGEAGTIVAVRDPGGKSFSRLMGMSLSPGARLKLIRKLPNGATIVEINGGKAAIATEIARAIFVRKEPEVEDHRSSRPTELG